jgi:hypothetical protein
MRLNENEVNDYLQTHLGQYEDSFQQAWLEIVECDPQTFDEIPPITRRIRNRALKQYLNKKFREQSLYDPIGRNGDERFTLESILQSPTNESNQEQGNGSNGLYEKIVDFLIGEYLSQKNENLAFKRKEVDLKAERLRLREDALKFKKDRFESWMRLMEDKGREKENRLRLKIQLQREKYEFKKVQLILIADKTEEPFSSQMDTDIKNG